MSFSIFFPSGDNSAVIISNFSTLLSSPTIFFCLPPLTIYYEISRLLTLATSSCLSLFSYNYFPSSLDDLSCDLHIIQMDI